MIGIERLKALREIELLKARRDRAADTKDWALYESLHAPDHVSENGDYGRWTSEIEFVSAEKATGIWAMEGMSFWQQDGEDHWFQAFGHYRETYEKRGGRWLFTWRKLTYYHTRKSPGAVFPPKISD